jgi:CheY-like chemotaxis protein
MPSAQILVVEDESIVARNIQMELTGLGYKVPAIVSSGEDALQKVAETHPDLVLMDIVLKGDLDGVQTAEQIRERYDVPVVFLTAYADERTLQRAKRTEPFGYLLKPYEERELETTIEIALQKHKTERVLKESQPRHQGDEPLASWDEMEILARRAIGMVNDFNQFLTAIRSNIARVLSGLAPGDPNREYLAAADEAATHALELVQQLHNFHDLD